MLLAASPILEEYFFRGVLYGRCKELVSAPAAAFMTAAFFGVFHWDLVQGIYSFFMGLILAYLMEKTNTVKAPVVFHFAANLAALVLEVFRTISGNPRQFNYRDESAGLCISAHHK